MNPVEEAANRAVPQSGGVLRPLAHSACLAPVLATPAVVAVPGVQAVHDNVGPPIAAVDGGLARLAVAPTDLVPGRHGVGGLLLARMVFLAPAD